MSGTSVNKKMLSAFQKVGNALGYKFKTYRSVDYNSPVQEKNYVGDVTLSFALDEGFKTPIGSSYKQYNLFLNTTGYQTGDIFVNETLGKRFVLVNKDPIVAPQGIETPHTITISRPGYSTTGGTFKSGMVEVLKDLPAAIFEVGSAGQGAPVAEVKNGSAAHQYSIWVWLPNQTLKIDDVVTDQLGNKSRIISIEYSSVGYKLTTRDAKVGN